MKDDFHKNPTSISPEEFEVEVEKHLRKIGGPLADFTITRREKLQGDDGNYEIDVLVKFRALEANFTVLVECKRHKNPIKREIVQALYSKVRSLGAQKGIIFSTAEFQSGAIKYALKHGIALIKVEQGGYYITLQGFIESYRKYFDVDYHCKIAALNRNEDIRFYVIDRWRSDTLLSFLDLQKI